MFEEGREGGREGGRETVQYINLAAQRECVRWCTHLEEGGDTSLSPAVFISIILKEQGSNIRMAWGGGGKGGSKAGIKYFIEVTYTCTN